MATGQANRGVVFTLKTQTAPDYAKAFSPIHAEIDRLEKRMDGIFAGVPNTAFAQAQAQMAQVQQRMGGGSRSRNGASSGANDLDDEDARRRRSEARRAEFRRKGEQADREAADRMVKIAEKANDEVLTDTEKTLKAAEKLRESAAEKDRKRAEREAEKRRAAGNRQLAQLVRTGPQAQEQDRRTSQRDQERRDREHTDAINRAREAQQRLTGSLNESLDSVMRLSRGFIELGLVGERDSKRIMDALLAVQGTIDTVRGGIDTFRTFRGAFDAMRNVRSLQGAAGAVRGGGMLSSLLGVGGGAAGATGAGGTAAAGGLAAAAAPIAAFVAAIGSAALAIKVTASTISDANRYGFRGGAAPGSYNAVVGGAEEGLVRRGINMGHSVASAFGMGDKTYNRLAKFGLNSSPIGALFSESVNAAQSDRDTQKRLEKYQTEKKQREEMDARHRTAFGGRFDEAMSGYRDYQQQRAFAERMMATGDTKQDTRARFEGLFLERQRAEQVRAVAQQQINAEEGPNGAIRNRGTYEDATERKKQIEDDILKIDRERSAVAKQLLEYQKQGAEAMAKSLTDKHKGQMQDVSKMNPYQLQNLNRIFKKQQAGQSLARHELDFVDRFGTDEMRRSAAEERQRVGKEQLRRFAPDLYARAQEQEQNARDARRKANLLEQEQVRRQNAFDKGKPTGSAVPPSIPAPPVGGSAAPPNGPSGPQLTGGPDQPGDLRGPPPSAAAPTATGGSSGSSDQAMDNLAVALREFVKAVREKIIHDNTAMTGRATNAPQASKSTHDVKVSFTDDATELTQQIAREMAPALAGAFEANAQGVLKKVPPMIADAIARQNGQGRQNWS